MTKIPDLHRDLIDETFGHADESIPTNITCLNDDRYLVVTVDLERDVYLVRNYVVTVINDRRITYDVISTVAV